MKYPITALTLLSVPVVASAHHSRAEFSEDVTELTGELVHVFWRNPHAGLDILVRDGEGNEAQWRIETFGSPNTMSRWGVEREFFNVGEQVTVAGSVSTRRDGYMLGTNVLFENGMEAILGATMSPVWSEKLHRWPRFFRSRSVEHHRRCCGEQGPVSQLEHPWLDDRRASALSVYRRS